MTLAFTMVTWEATSGKIYETRTFTCQLPAVIADIESVGGQVIEHHEEGN